MLKKKKTDFSNIIIENNPYCCDCSINYSSFISINNGVTLCKECSIEHIKYFKKSISFILDLKENIIGEEIYVYFKYGGNSIFKNDLYEFGYDLTNKNIEQKYKSLAADYYRKKLYNIVHGLRLEEDLITSKSNYSILISEQENNDNIEKLYPEFIPYIQGKHLKKKNYPITLSKKLYEQQNISWKVTKNQFLSFKNWFFKILKKK